MTKINDITSYIERLAPLSSQESYDNSGLIVGNQNQEITNVLVSLDCIESTVDEAIERVCNLIVSHHPIVFKGLKKINGTDYIQRTILKAIKNDIAIYACHTNLDNYRFENCEAFRAFFKPYFLLIRSYHKKLIRSIFFIKIKL